MLASRYPADPPLPQCIGVLHTQFDVTQESVSCISSCLSVLCLFTDYLTILCYIYEILCDMFSAQYVVDTNLEIIV
jgi:hypothetical protein